jgi:E3 ubiquitin-protein ligase SIAH1
MLQCGVGHVLYSTCRAGLTKCPLCSRTVFERCFAMERAVESVVVPCSFAKDGCTKEIAYLNKKRHEETCWYGSCFCPESGCNFTGPSTSLLDHFTTHKWSPTQFKYYKQFDLIVRSDMHALYAQEQEESLFLVNMEPVEPIGHTISIVFVHPNATKSWYWCSVIFSWFTRHLQILTMDKVRCSSLSDGMPKDFFCVVPNVAGEVMLRTTIDTVVRTRERTTTWTRGMRRMRMAMMKQMTPMMKVI